MSKQPGYIVQTRTGLRGRTKHTDHRINGKIIVYLEQENLTPVLDEKGNQKKLLCKAQDLKHIGFKD